MKKLFIYITLSFALLQTSRAQSGLVALSPATTDEEYNYVTRGYAAQVSQGLDMKKGYHFNNIGSVRHGDYNFDVKVLMRETSNEIAAVLVIVKSLIWNKTYYICIPHGDTNLENRYNIDTGNWDLPLTKAFSQVFTLAFGGSMANMYECEKRAK
jgi:hypothetical protein